MFLYRQGLRPVPEERRVRERERHALGAQPGTSHFVFLHGRGWQAAAAVTQAHLGYPLADSVFTLFQLRAAGQEREPVLHQPRERGGTARRRRVKRWLAGE